MSLETKLQQDFQAHISDYGYLCIKQVDPKFSEEVVVVITPSQWAALQNFVCDNADLFETAWNDGIVAEDE